MDLLIGVAVKSIKLPTDSRTSHPWLAALLPIGFLLNCIALGFAVNPFLNPFFFHRDPDLVADVKRDLEKRRLE